MPKSYRPAGVGMIPAEPRTYLVHAYFDDSQVELVRTNVLAWQVSQERILTPLVVDQHAAEDDPWFVIQPDERVECSGGRCWDNAEVWIEEERRRRREALVEGKLEEEHAKSGAPKKPGKAEPAIRRDADEQPTMHRIPQAMPDPEPVKRHDPSQDVTPDRRQARFMEPAPGRFTSVGGFVFHRLVAQPQHLVQHQRDHRAEHQPKNR